jgi:glycine betaine/proline transport system permease protein
MSALVATFIYAVPPIMRLTDLAIRQVAPEAVEAGVSFGSTPSQLLFKVQIPMGLKTIMTGVNQTIMMALAMVVIASMIGAGGLGNDVLVALSQLVVGKAFLSGLSIVILAIVIDRIAQRTVRQRPAAAR